MLIVLAGVLGLLALTGCGGYQLRGKVIEGTFSGIEIVSKDDPRLGEPGVGGVSLHLQNDPNRLNRETIVRGSSGPDGSFELPVDLTGAGLLEYDVGLFARRKGLAPAQSAFRLPSSGRRVLITMAPGEDRDLGEERTDPLSRFDDFR